MIGFIITHHNNGWILFAANHNQELLVSIANWHVGIAG